MRSRYCNIHALHTILHTILYNLLWSKDNRTCYEDQVYTFAMITLHADCLIILNFSKSLKYHWLKFLLTVCKLFLGQNGGYAEDTSMTFPGNKISEFWFETCFKAFNSLAPGRCNSHFKCIVSHPLQRIAAWYPLWDCSQVNATESYKYKINIDSDHVLMPSSNNPLPEPMLTHIYVAIWHHRVPMS